MLQENFVLDITLLTRPFMHIAQENRPLHLFLELLEPLGQWLGTVLAQAAEERLSNRNHRAQQTRGAQRGSACARVRALLGARWALVVQGMHGRWAMGDGRWAMGPMGPMGPMGDGDGQQATCDVRQAAGEASVCARMRRQCARARTIVSGRSLFRKRLRRSCITPFQYPSAVHHSGWFPPFRQPGGMMYVKVLR